MKTVELINTGTELLLGNVLNRHLSWLGKALFPLGLRIARQTTVPDGVEIRNAIMESVERGTEIILVTGGLGPTADDVTREVVSGVFGLALEEKEEVIESIRARCERRGITFRESMARQAFVPRGGIVLPNQFGTAPGIYLPASNQAPSKRPHVFLLPGPPRELHPMFENQVRDLLAGIAPAEPHQDMRIYRIVGMGESFVEEKIGREIETSGSLEVGYCARPNEVDFRLIGAPAILDGWHDRILDAVGENLVCIGEESMETIVGNLLIDHGKTLCTAESCTGGLLANRLTNVPGISAVFLEGIVTYSNASKMQRLGVPEATIDQFGAVSAETATAMAEGGRKLLGADYALSTTGIAGPGGGTPENPVGIVFIGIAGKTFPARSAKFSFPTDRTTYKDLAAQTALDLLRRQILQDFT